MSLLYLNFCFCLVFFYDNFEIFVEHELYVRIFIFSSVLFKHFCFWQAVADVNLGVIEAKEKLYQLKALQSLDRCDEVSLCCS